MVCFYSGDRTVITLSTELFLNAAALLIKSRDEYSKELVDDLLKLYYDEVKRNPVTDTSLNRQFVQFLDQLKKLPSDETTAALEKSSLIVKFLSNPEVKRDELLIESIKELFKSVEESSDENSIEKLQKRLNNSVLWNKINRMSKSIGSKLIACTSVMDEDKQEMYLNDAINLLRKSVELAQENGKLASGAVERILFSDKESIRKALEKYKKTSVTGVLKTGLQGLNAMLGKRGGFAKGECACIFALQHNFKSGLLLSIARGFARYNIPQNIPIGRKPLILFISLENEANMNMMQLYRVAYETTYQRSADGMSDEEIIAFTHEFYTKTGYEIAMERYEGRKFGFDEYVNLIESYEAAGYCIEAVLLDYANKMKKGSVGTSDKRDDLAISELFCNLCNYNKVKGITFITAHQFNRDAMRVSIEGKNNVVKNFGSWCAAGSIGPSQEIDLEIFAHLETNHNGKKFLTVQRGKHRYVDTTPEAAKYFAYPFTPFGIGDDIEGEPQFVRDIYVSNESNSEETAEIDPGVF